MRIGAIDIGTNTILLLVCDVSPAGVVTEVRHEERTPRLGRDVDRSVTLTSQAIEAAVVIVSEYAKIAEALGAARVRACATSAVRDSANGREFGEEILRRTGVPVRILSGDEEARLTYLGAVGSAGGNAPDTAVIDIGGGSTEIIFAAPLRHASLQIGAVRLREKFFSTVPPSSGDLARASESLRILLDAKALPRPATTALVGVAGTVTTLACLDQGLEAVLREKVEGYTMEREVVRRWVDRLLSLAPEEVTALSAATTGREDILGAGALILDLVMDYYGFAEVSATVRGLRYGFAAAVAAEIRNSGPA